MAWCFVANLTVRTFVFLRVHCECICALGLFVNAFISLYRPGKFLENSWYFAPTKGKGPVVPLKKIRSIDFFKRCQYISYHEGIQKTS